MLPTLPDVGLYRSELYPSFVTADRKLLGAMTLEGVYQAGDQLYAKGADHQYVWRVRTGWCCRSRYLPNAKRQILLIFLPGDLLSLKSMLIQVQVDGIEFLTRSTLSGISQIDLHHLASQNYDVATRLMWQLSEEERRLHHWVVGLGLCSAEERMAGMLIDFYNRLTPLGLVKDQSFTMPLTQQQIGQYLGLTFVHVNRVLQRIRAADIAVVRGGRAVISNLDELHRMARPMLGEFEKVPGSNA